MGRCLRAALATMATLLAVLGWNGSAFAQDPVAADFQKVTLDDNTQNPMELDVAPDGRVFYIERDGRVMIWKPNTQQTVTAGTVPVTTSQENGLLGLQLAPDFAFSNWVYLFYSQLPDSTNTQIVARFKVNGDTLDLASEQRILTFQHQRGQCCHSSGSLYFGPDGSLYVSTGDNTNPFDSSGFNPIDERSGREAWDAQRTSANTNDLNGKILRIVPKDIPTGAPGPDATYTIPAGNLFPEAQDTDNKTRPEIFGMGFRNPFRFTVDPETGWVLMGDYGPDASAGNANRGPQGSVEFNAITGAGNFGWPYCIRDNTPYNDYNFATSTSGTKFDCANPVNDSPNNTGRSTLPPARGASAWLAFNETDPRFGASLGTGGAPMGGPRYHYDPALVSSRKFPAFYDDKWFIAEWNNGWIRTADLNATGAMTGVQAFARGTGYRRPMDLDFGPDGALYVIEWGSGFNGNNADSGVYRVDYLKGDQNPVARATGTPTEGLSPLAVQFSSAGSSDPEGTALTYAWDFGDGQTSTAANPSHTFAANGTYQVKLTVSDAGGLTGVANTVVTVGNRTPQVTIEFPENGQIASFTDKIKYKIAVTDPEDGSTGSGISCNDVIVKVQLGHDEHAHGLSDHTGCEGTVNAGLTSGHGAEANTFTVLGVSYTDKGGPGGIAPLTGRAEAILQPKTKQAEFFASASPGVSTQNTTDAIGGGLNVTGLEDGDWVSYKPISLKGINALRFRVAGAANGGSIEVHTGSATGPLVAATPQIAPTGGNQTYKTVELAIPATTGTTELFLVFRNAGATGNLLNLNQIEFVGQGAAATAPPVVSVNALGTSGNAPMTTVFNATATDPDGAGALTYAWDFGDGTAGSTQQDPSHLYGAAGSYVATLTVTDADGGVTYVQTPITVGAVVGQCPTGFRDDFNGTDLAAGWNVIRRDQNLTVANGLVTIPTQAGDLYTTSNTAKNVVLRPAPSGPFTIVAKVNHKGLVQYQQAGVIVYGTDDNYVKLDRTASNAATAANTEFFEFIQEQAGTARNATQDRTSNLAATFPQDFYVRIAYDGTNLTSAYSTNNETWTTVGRASTPLPANAQVGFFALSNAAATTVNATFDWFTLDGPNVPPDPNCVPGSGGNTAPVIGTATASKTFGVAPLGVDFAGTATDVDGDPLTYLWDYDNDGDVDATGPNATAAYGTSSTAKLTVTDGKGGVATRTIAIQVLAPDDPAAKLRALVFSKTAAFRHGNITAGINALKALGTSQQWQVDTTEDSTWFADDVLSHYDTVIFLSTTGDVLDATQQAAFERYIRAGGGYAGIHAAADTEYGWPWYGQLVGAYFRNHPNGTPTATIVREDKTDPSTAAIPDRWTRADEWYNYQSPVNPVVNGGGDDYNPRNTAGIHVLLTMDESTYAEADGSDGVDDDHPIAWCHRYDGGRAWYSGLAHTDASFSEAAMLSHLQAGIEITAGVTPSAACGKAPQANQNPTVVASRTPTGDVSTGTSVAFSATASDPDGDPITYAWDFGDGANATSAAPAHAFTAPGTYAVKVTVSDGKGGTATATLSVVVTQANRPPTVTAARTPTGDVATGAAIAFSATAADPDGDTLTYAWDFGDGGSSALANVSKSYLTPGEYAAKVTVSDGRGGTASATLPVKVTGATCTAGYRDDFNGSALGAGWSIVRGDGAHSLANGLLSIPTQVGDLYQTANTAKNLVLRPAPAGPFTIVTKVNHKGLVQYQQAGLIVYGTDDNYVKIDRTATNTATAANTEKFEFIQELNATARNTNQDYTANLAATFPQDFYLRIVYNGTNLVGAYSTDGTAWTTVGRASTALPANAQVGVYALSNAATTQVTPTFDWFTLDGANVPPTCSNTNPTVTAARTPTGNVRVGVPVAFTAAGTDADGDALTYAWDFGDGTTSTEQNPTKTFLAAATRTVKVTVSDGKGGTGSAELPVVVQANRNPTIGAATVATPQAGIAPLVVNLTGAATDADGHTVSYSWDLDGDGTFETTTKDATITYSQPGTYSPVLRVTDPFGGVATRALTVNVLAAELDPAAKFKVLIYSRTAGFRHSSIDEGITAIKKLGTDNGFAVDAIEEPSLFTDAFLARYDAVVFLSTTGDTLPDAAQQAAFERYIQAGHGYVGIHAASDTEYGWSWYGQLVGAYFRNHPNGTPTATVVNEDAGHPSTAGIPARWTRVDEWYNYQSPVNPVVNGGGTDYSARNTSGIHVLLTMDESTYAEADGSDGVDDDHPIAWCHRYDGGRAWYTGLGHTEASFLDPVFLGHLLGGLQVAAGIVDDAACGVVKTETEGGLAGNVPQTLALTLGAPGSFGTFVPGVAREYNTTMTANVISTASAAELSVRDPSFEATGRLVNGTRALAQPLRVGIGDVFAPLKADRTPLALKRFGDPVSNDTTTIAFKQAIGADEPLATGAYAKTLVFMLSTSTP
ncbi:ThuA domain-containing protein [Solirubrobacter taibaiensis]|nr:ThuA domain-containing protein [Solirubrobacter taibaiensis]